MEPSSRTPEGEPNRCPVCGKAVRIEPTRPPGDAPCPHCGHLLWFKSTQQTPDLRLSSGTVGTGQERLGEFTLDDFKKLLGQTQKLGPLKKILGMLPGMAEAMGKLDADKDIRVLLGIIDSMTPDERQRPAAVIDQSHCHRIAAGAAVEPHEVNELVKQYESMADMMKRMSSMGIRGRMRLLRDLTRRLPPTDNEQES